MAWGGFGVSSKRNMRYQPYLTLNSHIYVLINYTQGFSTRLKFRTKTFDIYYATYFWLKVLIELITRTEKVPYKKNKKISDRYMKVHL